MRGLAPSTPLIVVVPIVALAVCLAALQVDELATLRGDVSEFRRSVQVALHSRRALRQLASLGETALESLSGDPLDQARRDRSVAALRAELRALRHADPRARYIGRVAKSDGVAEREIDRLLARASELAGRGDFETARRLVEDDLALLIELRLAEPLARFAPAPDADLEAPLRGVRRHWLVGNLEVDALRDAGLGVLNAESIALDVERELQRLTATSRRHAGALRRGIPESVPEITPFAEGVAAELPTDLAATRSAIDERLRRARTADSTDAPRELAAALALIEAALLPGLDELADRGLQFVEQRGDRIRTTAAAWMIGLVCSALLTAAAGGLVPWFLGRTWRKPLRKLLLGVQGLRTGQWNPRALEIDLSRDDEIGRMARSLDELAARIVPSDSFEAPAAVGHDVSAQTGPPLLEERLHHSLVASKLRESVFAVMSVQLDLGQLGVDAAADIQQQAALRLCAGLRLGEVLGRPVDSIVEVQLSQVSSGEFLLLLTNLNEPQDAGRIARRLSAELARPFEINPASEMKAASASAAASIGIALYPVDADDATELVACARSAASRARERAASGYEFFSEALNSASLRLHRIATRLRDAIDRHELSLHFQPLRDARSGAVSASEVLLRFSDPALGPVPPSEFLPIAREAGLAERIGRWVLRNACEQGRAWRDAGYRPIRLSVNVGALQLREPGFVEAVEAILTETGTSPGDVELEITEDALVGDADYDPMGVLTALDEMGVGLVIDDFGSDASSLTHLQRLPIRRVKIDACFVASLGEEAPEHSLLGAILAMTRSLGLRTVAAGIETLEQADFVRELGCDEMQGFLFSPGVDAEAFERFLKLDKAEAD